jgi:putative heme-binding domain-containing protein
VIRSILRLKDESRRLTGLSAPGLAFVVTFVMFATCCIPLAAFAQGQRATAPAASSRPTVNDVEAGSKVFATACRICHGEEGVGNRAPALRGNRFTADFVSRTVKHGRPDTLMPKFGGSLSEAEINQVGKYVASLQERSAEWAVVLGNPEAGRALFFDQTNQQSCRNCHTFKGEGGKVGPDLTTRLARRSPREIFQRIVVVPHRSTDPSYLTVQITTKSGETFSGIKTEGSDKDQFHFYDTSSLPPTLRTLPSKDIVSTKRLNGTAMPSDYASRLSLKNLLDLVAFLRSTANSAPVTLADVIQEPSKR